MGYEKFAGIGQQMVCYGMGVALCMLTCIVVLLSISVILRYRHREKILLKRLDEMLNAAINGSFTISSFGNLSKSSKKNSYSANAFSKSICI